MAEELLQSSTITTNLNPDDNRGNTNINDLNSLINYFFLEQNIVPSTSLNELTMMDTSTKEQQISVVDDATLQAVLSSMTETQVHAFLEELNKTGKACKLTIRTIDSIKIYLLDLPGIGQTIELLTVPAPPETASTQSTITVLPTTQEQQSQTSAEILLQELTSLMQQPPADLIALGMEQKSVQQPIHTGTSVTRQTRTANTYGGTSVMGGSGRPGTAVKSTITPAGSATIRKSVPQQILNDDRMFFGRPTTVGQQQYHNRTGLMSNKQQLQQSMASSSSSLGQHRRITPSTGFEYHQYSSQRRPLSWFQ